VCPCSLNRGDAQLEWSLQPYSEDELIMAYATRTTLTPSQSDSSMPQLNGMAGRLSPSVSADALMKAAAQRKLLNPTLSPIPQNKLGQSLSVTSLLSVESDTSAPPPVAPPRSAQLNTGEVLQPYAPTHLQATGSSLGMPPTIASQVHSVQQPMYQNSPAQPRRGPYHSPAMGQNMAVVQSHSVINREPTAPEPPPPPPQAVDSQSTWVIEEVIDFGVPLDEGMVQEYDDRGYPMGCKSLAIGESSRGNGNIFDGCLHNVCHDEQEGTMHDRREHGLC